MDLPRGGGGGGGYNGGNFGMGVQVSFLKPIPIICLVFKNDLLIYLIEMFTYSFSVL